MVTQELLQELFSYDNGNLYWKTIRSTKNKIGQKVGRVGKKGYLYVRINYKAYSLHRIIWIFHNGNIENNKLIDHIDRNILNNKIENLRLATYSQNNQNSRKQINNSSGYKNIVWSKERKVWKVRCYAKGISRSGGSFVCIDDAIQAAIELRKKYHCEFAQDDLTC